MGKGLGKDERWQSSAAQSAEDMNCIHCGYDGRCDGLANSKG